MNGSKIVTDYYMSPDLSIGTGDEYVGIGVNNKHYLIPNAVLCDDSRFIAFEAISYRRRGPAAGDVTVRQVQDKGLLKLIKRSFCAEPATDSDLITLARTIPCHDERLAQQRYEL